MFAVAAFDEQGDLVGEGIGDSCSPVETVNPLPLPLCWAHLSRTALGLGCSSLAAQVKKTLLLPWSESGKEAQGLAVIVAKRAAWSRTTAAIYVTLVVLVTLLTQVCPNV